jgi:hypothetical protein
MSATDHKTQLRELARRFSDGIDVRLLWRPDDDRTLVTVDDSKSGEAFTMEVGARQRPLHVFEHPFAYAR